MTEKPTQTDGITRSASSANESYDSAIQYVSVDLLENGFDADEQRELLAPVEDEIRKHMETALRDGMRKTFRSGSSNGATFAIEYLVSKLSFEQVPEEYREDIEILVEKRLEEKRPQLEGVFHDLKEDALHKAGIIPEDQIVNWGPVV